MSQATTQAGHASLIIRNIDWLITVDRERRVIRDAAIAVEGGRIAAVGKSAAIERDWRSERIIEGRGTVATPGLIDAVRVIARHHRDAADLQDDETSRYARILAVAERYAELTLGDQRTTPSSAIEALRREPALDQELVQMLEEGLNLPAIWRAA